MSMMVWYNSFYFWFLILGAVVLIMLPFVLSLLYSGKVYLIYWSIFQVNNSVIDLPLILDGEGMLTSMTVLFISCNVFRFAVTYMFYEKFLFRFNVLVLLFVLSMNLLIFIPNLMTLLLGWDGLGLTSFLLVIYYQNPKSLGGGMITALTNRIGDGMLMLAIVWTLNSNNWNIMGMWESNYDFFIGMSIVIAGMTKSAQMPFSSWLPAAMAAPTPVSALVHSSTLVTAGVFLLVRFYSFISHVQYFETFLLLVSCATMFMAAFSAVMECDLKKIIALSTLSQLGVMMTSLAVGLPKLALFHLITHALFKALLFVCAGSFIFLHGHNQDLRFVGGLMGQLPLTSACFIIGSMSLCGLPFLSGFYSKDLILEVMLSSSVSFFILSLVMLATGGTALYSMRLAAFSVMGPVLSNSYHNLSNEDSSISVSCLNLVFGAIFGGAVMNWMLSPLSIEIFLEGYLKFMPVYLIVIGGVAGFLISSLKSHSGSLMLKVPLFYDFICSMWYMAPLSSQGVLNFLKPAYYYLSVVDHGWVEGASAQGSWALFMSFSQGIQPVQAKMLNIMLSLSMLSFLFILFIF